MSNDMPDIIYTWKDEAGYCDFWKNDKDYMEGGTKYYSESHVQQLIKEAEERQREKCWEAAVDSKQHMKINHIDYTVLRNAILNAGGE